MRNEYNSLVDVMPVRYLWTHWLPVHDTVNHVGVLNNNSDLRISVSFLGPVVKVCGTNL